MKKYFFRNTRRYLIVFFLIVCGISTQAQADNSAQYGTIFKALAGAVIANKTGDQTLLNQAVQEAYSNTSNISSAKTSTLDAVKNILTDYVNKQYSVNSETNSSSYSSTSSQQNANSLNGITASNFGGDVNCTDEYLTEKTKPTIERLSVGANNVGACEAARRVKELHNVILDITSKCKANSPGILDVRQGSINAILEANQTIKGICGN